MTKNQIGNLFVETQKGAIPVYSNSFPDRSGKDKFGFGFVITSDKDNGSYKRKPRSFWRAGLWNTYYWVDPKSGISAVLLMQVLPIYEQHCQETLNKFEELIYRNLNNN